jgi:ADP-ribose pyrophosphatase YjhB (NUDIX family)
VDAELAAFLAEHDGTLLERTAWDQGRLPLEVRASLCRDLPPLPFVTSVRALVLRDDQVLVLRNRDGAHLLPGGRIEAGESLAEALRREVQEETGWTLEDPQLLGFLHFRHLARKPAGYTYPHPDFLQLVYVAQAGRLEPAARAADDYETEARFRPTSEIERLELPPSHRFFLAASREKAEVSGC